MLDYIYHMTLKLLKNHILGVKSVKILLSFLSLKKVIIISDRNASENRKKIFLNIWMMM